MLCFHSCEIPLKLLSSLSNLMTKHNILSPLIRNHNISFKLTSYVFVLVLFKELSFEQIDIYISCICCFFCLQASWHIYLHEHLEIKAAASYLRDKQMDAVIGVIVEMVKGIWPPLYEYVQYHRKLQENLEIFRRKLLELNSRKDDIELRLSRECHLGKLPKAEVNIWLQNVQRINNEAQSIEQKVKEVKGFSRARLGKVVNEKIQEVKEYYQNGASESVAIDAPPASGLVLPTTKLVGDRTEKKTMDEIWEYLMSNEVMKIGVCGMGGSGKTTIITHINDRLLNETSKFKNVIWVTVSQPLDLKKLQNQIADALEENHPRNEDQIKRAGHVLKMLEKAGKFVLILDDLWEAFPLEKVGIPEPTEKNECKLVITTRSIEVCRVMGCKVVDVKPLPEDEALKLFSDKVGENILRRPTLEETIKLVVEQCAGLPLAIVTVASCMKGVDDIHEWRNALYELANRTRSAKDSEVLATLQFSYDRLQNERLKHCFLYCSLYPEDFKISKDELIAYWIAEGLVDEMDSEEATYDKGHTILKKLENNCLLEGADDGEFVKMHDLIREMALDITSKCPLFMIKADEKLREFPKKEEWKTNLEKVSLMLNDILEIPSKMSPNCRALSTLLLQRNYWLKKIPESFFVNMPELKIDLSYTRIDVLPNSVSDLCNLTALLLGFCESLRHIPSLRKLMALKNLNIESTKIREFPEGMEKLENLRYLNLRTFWPCELPVEMLSKLRRLQKLRLNWESLTSYSTEEEAAGMGRLDTFEAHFRRVFYYNWLVRSFKGPMPKNYHFLVRDAVLNYFDDYFEPIKDVNKFVSLYHVKKFYDGGTGKKSEVSILLPEDIQYLRMMHHCHDLGSLSDLSYFNEMLSKQGELTGKFSDLKALYLVGCRGLKNLFSHKMMWALGNLEVIDVAYCEDLEQIFEIDDGEKSKQEGRGITYTFILPKLRKLRLYGSKLSRICGSNGVLVCDSLQEIHIYKCPNVNRLPLSLPFLDNGQASPHPAIKQIKVEKHWWESLKWDNPNAKNVLEPYCHF